MTLRVALVQLRTPDDLESALAHLGPLVREAAARGARFILTPEAANLVQRDRAKLLDALRPLEDDPVAQGLGALARELSVTVLAGSLLCRREDGRPVNRSVLFSAEGQVQATYDKIHMFDVDLPTGERWRESDAFAAGERAVVAPTPWGRLGMTVCYDLRFPHLFRALAKAGAEMIAVPAAFTRPTGEAHWETLLRARAIETGAFVLAPAQGGLHADGRATWGRSMAVDPWGAILAQACGDEPGVIMAELDLEAVGRARRAVPSLQNEREFVLA
ncbi:MAG: carbon-nitrogen hydrolase family protein [Pseudomonadota bacterium]|nr:carbon-nitrogen hydrolase family protein [Pseudomonadota bacterium]